MTIPKPNIATAEMIDRYHESKKDAPRYNLGPSDSGLACDRAIWLRFRWALQSSFPGRILRLFRRGQNEEAIAESDLRAIGCVFRNTGHNQLRLEFGCHVSGSPDGIIESGLPEAPLTRHVWENKTHNKKSFDEVEKKGVEVAKPEHYTQMQCYMMGTDIDRALYEATCKDDDRLYFERVEFDKETAVKAITRLQRIAVQNTIPGQLSSNPTWYECKMCNAYQFCHVTKKATRVNCRTCAHSTARGTGDWFCERHNSIIEKEYQLEGCRAHVPHPDLVPWKLNQEKSTKWCAWYDGIGLVGENSIDSREVMNG